MKNKKPVDYNHLKIEPKWRKVWEKEGVNKTADKTNKPKFYILDMFPYPSGQGLHVGHPRGFVATDVYSRYKKMQGFNVLHPMGWDAFGLPAENYAIKMKVNPMVMGKSNVKRYKDQIGILGLNYDWSREVNTTDPEYYKWTQWAFLQMYKKGLVFQSNEPINWCPTCKTGLANEDLEDGKCERCNTPIEKKPLPQWVIKITDYADRLLTDLDTLKDWPENVKEAQRNWIGRSEGAEVEFLIVNSKIKIKVFTTRADTLFGVTYVVLAPESKLVQELKFQVKNWSEVEKYISDAKNKTEIERTAQNKDKTGVELKGIQVINPANKEKVPVWISDYVLADYGTGAVMAVPAHDERDFAFAQKYNLPIKQVIVSCADDSNNPPKLGFEEVKRNTVIVHLRDKSTGKYALLNWHGTLEGIATAIMGGIESNQTPEEAALAEIFEESAIKGVKIIKKLQFITGARYCASHKSQNRTAHTYTLLAEIDNINNQGIISENEQKIHTLIWVDESKVLQTLTPDHQKEVWQMLQNEVAIVKPGYLINSGQFDGKDSERAKKEISKAFGEEKVSYKLKDWVFSRQRYWGEPIPLIHCEKCGVVPVPEKDLPVELPKVKFYEPTGTGESPLAAITKWVNTKCPKCGGKGKRETNTMPQWAGSSWYYLRYIDPQNKKVLVDKNKEKYWSPVDFYVGGGEHNTRHLIYARFWHKFLFDIGVVNYTEPFLKLRNLGMILGSDGRKMSKRWGNVVNPDEVVKNVGADTLRVYEMFMGPFDQEIAWSTNNMVGSRRFLDKVWKLQEKIVEKRTIENKEFETLLHKTIKKVTEDILDFGFNTAISAFMILVNAMEKAELTKTDYEIILKLLAPFAPHLSEEIWANLGHKKSIHLESWPEFDKKKIITDEIVIMVQINGKPRANFRAPNSSTQIDVEKIALLLPEVKKWVEGKKILNTMFVKGKILIINTN